MNFLDRLLRLHPESRVPIEDFFTEVLAGLFRYRPEIFLRWLEWSELAENVTSCRILKVNTQVRFQALEDHAMSSRPDLMVRLIDESGLIHVILIESKIGSSEGTDQLSRYAEHLSEMDAAAIKTLLYVTRDYDPKRATVILKNAPDVAFVQTRWSDLYVVLKECIHESGREGSDLAKEVASFMESYGMSRSNRLGASDIIVMTGISKVLAFMQETLAGEVEKRLSTVTGHKISTQKDVRWRLRNRNQYFSISNMPGHRFKAMVGFKLDAVRPDQSPDLCVVVESSPDHEQVTEFKEAIRNYEPQVDYAGRHPDRGWPSIWWTREINEILGEEDHMAASRAFFFDALDDLKRFRDENPNLPWGA